MSAWRRRVRAWATRVPFPFKVGVAVVAVYSAVFWLTSEPGLVASRLRLWTVVAAFLAGASLVGLARRAWWGRLRGSLRQRFARETYDERRILSDLSYAARTVATRRQLFELIAGRIHEALGPAGVAIFVRDDETGDYLCEMMSAPTDSTGELEATREPAAHTLILSQDAFVIRRIGRLSMPLTLGADDYESWARSLASATRARREARRIERETLESVGAALLLPVMMKDKLVGVISLGARRGGAAYTAVDKRLLLSVAGQLAFIIENSKLAARIVEEERLRRELRMASEVQRRLFPEHAPASLWLELSGSCQPARGVGGDYYDFLSLDEHTTGVAVADVAGKGIAAALLMSIVQASLRSQVFSARGVSLAGLASTMNGLMYGSTGSSSYATFFYAQFDARTRQLSYVNAGHNPPLLWRARGADTNTSDGRELSSHPALRGIHPAERHSATAVLEKAVPVAADSRIEKLTTGGPVIGLLSGCAYEQATVEMRAGDVLLAYTDGVTEAFNAAGDEFGEERLTRILSAAAHLPANELRETIVQSVADWCGLEPQHDDLTIVVMKVK